MPYLKLFKHTSYAFSHTATSFFSSTCTPLYIQEQGRIFVHTMNYLVVQQHHQNIQMRSKNLMLKQILANVGFNVPLRIPDVCYIASLNNIYTTSTYDITHPPTYEHLHRNLLPEKEGNNKLVPYKKYLMSLITVLNSNSQLGRPKLIQIFLFWFEEDVISLCSEFNLERKTDSEKKNKSNEKKIKD